MRPSLSGMKTFRYKIILITGLLLCSGLHVASASNGSIETYTAPDSFQFTLPDLIDKQHSLTDYRGKILLVNFWASWCPPCIHEMPALQKLNKKLANDNFEIIALNVGEKKYKVRKFVNLIKLDLPVLLDTASNTFNQWNIKTLPTSFLIDADGIIRYRAQGNPGWDSEETINIINQLLTKTAKANTE